MLALMISMVVSFYSVMNTGAAAETSPILPDCWKKTDITILLASDIMF